MGLLDFLSSKPANNNTGQGGLVVTPPTSQAYTNSQQDPGPVAQKNYKDLQYPMPGAENSQLGASTIPEANGLQPKLTYATETLPPVTQVEDQLPHVETILDNGVRQVNHSADVNPSVVPNQPLYSYSDNPVPADVMVAQAEEQLPDTLPPEAPIDNTIVEAPVATQVPTEVPGVSIVQPVPEPQIVQPQAVDESKNGDIIEIGSAIDNPVSDESQQSVVPTTPVEQPVIPEVLPVPETQPEVTPVEPLQPLASEQPVVEVQPQPEIIAQPDVLTPTEPIAVPVPEVQTPSIDAVVEEVKQEETPVEQGVKPMDNSIETASTGFNILNKVAFVCLNSQSVNSSLSKKVKSLAEDLGSMIKEAYIDSNKGYGMDIISALSTSKLKVTAAYLKPYFSKYSDETNLDVPIENLTRITFSTVLDRIKYLYKEATVFIVPETSGINSLSQVMLLLNSQSMYFGTHKPVILFGTAWKDRMNTLKTSFALSQQELDSMYFAASSEEVVTLMKKLDEEFSSKNVKSNTEIDMRDEQGEKEGMLTA